MATTVITAAPGVTSHVISLRGVAGSICYCLVAASLFAIVAFTTEGWAQVGSEKGGVKIGLWMTCLCQPNLVSFTVEAWFRTTQAMVTMGLVCMTAATVTVLLYLFMHKFNKNRVIKAVLFLSMLSLVFTALGLVIFGMYTIKYGAMHGFSYVFGIISSVLCAAACVLSCVQMTKSRTLNCCPCCKCCRDENL